MHSNKLYPSLDNTLLSASLEMLLDTTTRNPNELEVIRELCEYLDKKFIETKNESYNTIKSMIQNNKHSSINSQKDELIKKYSTKEDIEENLSTIAKISRNRTKEIHKSSKKKKESIYGFPLLNKIQLEYAKELYNKK